MLYILLFYTFLVSCERTPRSIQSEESLKVCGSEEVYLSSLPKEEQPNSSNQLKYHLLLTVTDKQLWIFVNWLSVVFMLRYLPDDRVIFHIFCPPPNNQNTLVFVRNFLNMSCDVENYSVAKSVNFKRKTSALRMRMKKRLLQLLNMVLFLGPEDEGAMSFDLDAIWIHNMIRFFDYHHTSYDYISQATTLRGFSSSFQNNYPLLVVNFGGVFFRNTPAAKSLAIACKERLQQEQWNRFPDQETISEVLFDSAKATQETYLNIVSSFYNKQIVSNDLTLKDYINYLMLSGAHGNFSLNNIIGKYLLLPGPFAMRDCQQICSSRTILFQHCGIGYCTRGHAIDTPCDEIPEVLLHSTNINMDSLPQISSLDDYYKIYPKNSYHSLLNDQQKLFVVKILSFVNVSKVPIFCTFYPSVCTPSLDAKYPFLISVHGFGG